MIRSANPALDNEAFSSIKGYGQRTMSIQGAANKTFLLLGILLASAYFIGPLINLESRLAFIGALVSVLGLATFIMVYRHSAWWSAPLFSVVQGAVMGSLAIGLEARYPGIVLQAAGLTIAILFSLLFLYKVRIIDPDENMKLMVSAGTMGVVMVYLFQFVISAAGHEVIMIHESGWAGILFSLFAVSMASLNLVMDFDFIEEGERNQCEKSLEWYAAFGLMITLVWLYFELIHLLSKARE